MLIGWYVFGGPVFAQMFFFIQTQKEGFGFRA